MSIFTVLRWLLFPGPTEKFLDEAHHLGRVVLSKEVRDEELRRANELGLEVDSRKRWETWRQLIRIHERCDEQLGHLAKCQRFVSLAKRLKLNQEEKSTFVSSFESIGKGTSDLDSLKKAVVSHREEWKELAERVRELRPRVFVTHAFLMLSEVSGVEMVSLFVGGLIGLGAVYTQVFYCVAIGQSVAAYFTLDDLINQGILVLRQVAVALLLIEIFFLVLRGMMWASFPRLAYAPHWWVLRHPVKMVVIAAAFITSMTAMSAFVEGSDVRESFAQVKSGELELATVMDGTILENVRLVGTTSRTATFQQVRGWGRWEEARDGSRQCVAEVEKTTTEKVPAAAGAVTTSTGRETESEECALGPNVLIMDRALIVCHAEGTLCRDQARREGVAGSAGGDVWTREAVEKVGMSLKRLESGVDRVEERTASLPDREDWSELRRGLDGHLNEHVEEINIHLNRHLEHVGDMFEEVRGG